MVKKGHRLSRKEFNEIFRAGRAFNFPHFVVKYKSSKLPYSRAGISCGLKVSKKAVQRNTLRRKLYEVVRSQQEFVPRGDYIIIVRPSALTLSFNELSGEWRSAHARIYEAIPH